MLVAVQLERLRVGVTPGEGDITIDAVVEQSVYGDGEIELRARTGLGEALLSEQANEGLHRAYAVGEAIHCAAEAADLRAFPR